jgi:tetratricopeptide (TPR) repeat protein
MQEPALSKATEHQPPPPSEQPSGLGHGLAWLRAHLLMVGILVAALLLPVAGGAFLLREAARQAREAAAAVNLSAALAALDRGADGEAFALAESLAKRGGLGGGLEFIQGIVALRQADALAESGRAADYAAALNHLERARDLGWPQGRQAEGWFQLGRCLLKVGRLIEARAALAQALRAAPHRDREILPPLIRAYVDAGDSDLQPALAHLDAWQAMDGLSDSQRRQVIIDRARVLFRLGELDACRATLDQMAADAPQSAELLVMRARLLMHAAAEAQARENFLAAQALLRDVLARGARGRAGSEAMYLLGRCQRALGDDAAALSQFHLAAKSLFGTADGLAAAIDEADMLLSANRDDAAVAAYVRALSTLPPPNQYQNTWYPLDALRAHVVVVYQRLIDREGFSQAIKLSASLEPLFPPERALSLRAEAHRSYGRWMLAQADGLPPERADEQRERARAQLRAAGAEFARLAKLRFTERDHPEYLWTSAESSLAGRDYAAAAATYRDYLKNEGRRRRPAALLGLGEAELGLGQFEKAWLALSECIDRYPQDSSSFKARVLASRARFEQGELAAAESLLRQNIESDRLTPASHEWRDSLFALGWLLHFQSRWDEAIPRLEEAVERYPDAPGAIEAGYLIGHAYAESAREPQEQLAKAAADSDRVMHAQEMQRLLLAAVERYDSATDALLGSHESLELDAARRSILRNCYFGKGAALFDLGRYEEAIQVYSTAANRYHHSAESLEAFARIAACYRRLDRPAEFRGTLERARIVLRRMPDDARFEDATSFDRQEWGELLDWLGAL